MKLVVQIPCLNEAQTIAETVRRIPRNIPGIDKVEILIIDDGSTDPTISEAKKAGVHHLVSLRTTRGLAQAFMTGLEEALKLKADIIVNMDGDLQHPAEDIPVLIQPILDRKAEIVIGDRQIGKVKHFGFLKRTLEQFGSFLIRIVTGLPIRDAASGFRAFSKEAALRLNLWNHFSHTLETIVFAAQAKIPLTSVPVRTYPGTRPSRLSENMWSFVKQAAGSTLRIYLIYEPFKFFLTLGSVVFCIGSIPIFRLIYFHLIGSHAGHLPLLIVGAICVILGFILITIGLIADLLSINRMLIEKSLLESRRIRLGL